MTRFARFLSIPLVCFGLLAGTALAGGGARAPMPESSPPAESEKTPEQLAVEQYNRGLGYRDQAWKLEKKLEAASDDKQRGKLENKIRNAYQRAAREFRQAVGNAPTMFQAHSSLGYALRKTGDYEDALASYDRSLRLNPGYSEAIEYRAEAYLGLNRIEDAKQAYVTLFGNDRERADELMAAMKKWLEHRRRDDAGVDAGTLASFEAWVAEREEIARQNAALRPGGDGKGW